MSPPDAAAPARTSVLVLNYDGREHLDDCLGSLGALDVFLPGEPGRPSDPAAADEVVLVDNGSTDGSVARVRERFPWVRVLAHGKNLGFALGYDAAVPRADGEWVALLNSDTRVHPAWLSELHAAAARHPGCGAVASRILSWDGARVDFVGADTFFTGHAWQRGLGEPARGTPPGRELLFGCAAALLVRRETFLRHGGFDPDYFAFFEDVDLGWRMSLAGEGTWLAPEAVVHHKLHGTFGSRPRAQVRFLCERNALATAFKNLGEERAGVLVLSAAALTFLRGWVSSASSRPWARAWLTTDALAHLLALADLSRLAPDLVRRRAAAQAARRRSDTDLAGLFGDFARPPTALGAEYRGPLAAVVETLGLEAEGLCRAFNPRLCAAAREAALALFAACAETLGRRFEASAFVARAGDLDWEHPVGEAEAARLRQVADLTRELLLSRLDADAVSTFVRGLGPDAPPRAERPRPAAAPAAPPAPAPVTVVVRTKDRPAELREALASLAAQTFRDFEVVLVDDGEADAVPALAALGGASRTVRVVRTGGVGRSRAAQAGLEAAAGEFVNYLDDDDTLRPEHLERLVATQRETGARVVHSVAMQVASAADGAGGTRTVELGPIGGPLDPSRLFFESTLPLMTVLLDRELALEAGGFDPSLDYFEDWDLFMRLSRKATFAHCPHVTALYRVEPGAGHGAGVAGAHRWPFLAELFERHRDRIAGADWVRFYRDQVEATRLRLAAAEAERAAAAARLARLEAEAGALSERARAASEERTRVVALLRSVERSLGYRVGLFVRRLLGRA